MTQSSSLHFHIQSTLSAMHLSRLHLSSRAPVTARVLLRRSSSRRLLPSPKEATESTAPEQRRPSLVPTIPEALTGERRSTFRRRNVMSLVGLFIPKITNNKCRLYFKVCLLCRVTLTVCVSSAILTSTKGLVAKQSCSAHTLSTRR